MTPLECRARRLYSNAKANAKRRNVPFELSLAWIESALEVGTCQATGLCFDYHTQHPTRLNPLSPSLDRIRPAAGYTDDNCRVVLTAFNVAKSDWGEGVYRVIAAQYLERNPD